MKTNKSLKKFMNGINKRRAMIIGLAVIVVMITSYSLIIPALSLEKEKAEEQGGITLNAESEKAEDAKAMTLSSTNDSDKADKADKAEKEADKTEDDKNEAAESKDSKENSDKADDNKDSKEESGSDNAASDSEKKESNNKDADDDNEAEDDKENDSEDDNNDDDADEEENEDEDSSLTLTAEGKDYEVKILAGRNAGISKNAELTVEEIKEDSEDYDNYLTEIEKNSEKDESIQNARFFDITIMEDGREIEPEEDVDVEITLKNNDNNDNNNNNNDDLKVAHFKDGEKTPEDMDAETEQNKDESVVTFTAESFSVYSVYRVVSMGATGDLDGRSFVIGNLKDGNDFIFALTTESGNIHNGFTTLKYSKAYMRYRELIYTDDDIKPARWTFAAVTEPDEEAGITEEILSDADNNGKSYYVTTRVQDSTLYLTVNDKGVSVSETRAAIRIATSNKAQFAGMVNIKALKGLKGGNRGINLSGNGNRGYFAIYDGDNDPNNYQILFESEDYDINVLNETHTADKISVSKMQDGQKVVIYRSVWNEASSKYELMAIAGNGDLVRVTDQGSTVGWFSAERKDDDGNISPINAVEWTFQVGYDQEKDEDGNNVYDENGDPVYTNKESGYYWLYNEDTDTYLAPRAIYDKTGKLTADIFLPGDTAKFDASFQLPGRQAGDFDSRVIAWSKEDGTVGLYYDLPDDDLPQVKKSGIGHADKFNFAAVPEDSEELTTVDTIDTKSMGIKINMFNYKDRAWMSNILGTDQISTIGTSDRGKYVPGIVQNTLSENGLPVGTANGNTELTALFGGAMGNSTNNRKVANHLFIQAAYSETGYFEYNSKQNYAYLEEDGNFTVYDQIGAPDKSHSHDHGNFMPYSQILEEVYTDTVNSTDEYYGKLPVDDPRTGAKIHKIEKSGTVDVYDYNFGMTLEADFLQPESKKDRNGNPIIFEFSGDDDLWMFVDGVLVLDLGGIHSAIGGSVNFTTGEIKVTHTKAAYNPNGTVASGYKYPATIKAAFKQAGIFPDGSTWDDSKADEYFDGETFRADYSGHTMKIFYMERGRGASNLHMRFNLDTATELLVAKEVSGTEMQKYMETEYMFQAFLEDGESGELLPIDGTESDKLPTIAVKENGAWIDSGRKAQFKTVQIGDKEYKNVFMLAHGEGVLFHQDMDDRYYVREIGVDDARVESVKVNGSEAEARRTVDAGDEMLSDYTTSVASVSERRRVIFDNEIKANELHITKELALSAGQEPDPDLTFEFKLGFVMKDDSVKNFSVEPYYIVKDGTFYVKADGKMAAAHKGSDGNYYYSKDGVETLIPSKDPTDPVFDYSSQTGYISFVPAGYTVIVKGLSDDMTFRVMETNIPQGYALKDMDDEYVVTGSGEKTFDRVSKTISENSNVLIGEMMNKDAHVVAMNKYTEGKIRLMKIAERKAISDSVSEDVNEGEQNGNAGIQTIADEMVPLAGAEFELYNEAPASKDGHFGTHKAITSFTSDENGFFNVDKEFYGGNAGDIDFKLSAGTYYLRETKAPEGYVITEPVKAFMIDDEGHLVMTGSIVWAENEDGIEEPSVVWPENASDYDVTVTEAEIAGSMVSNQTGLVENAAGAELPMTGGCGTHMIYAFGLLLIACCGFALIVKVRAAAIR